MSDPAFMQAVILEAHGAPFRLVTVDTVLEAYRAIADGTARGKLAVDSGTDSGRAR
jgi:hypothetical protein